MGFTVVGKPIGRVEGPQKVRGETRYTADILLPGMLWGKALRSPLPHARILRIDTTKAAALPGVRAILTARDLPDLLHGRRMFDMPLLAKEKVRFIGEKVAVVAADDPDLAEEAVAQIEVEYEDLPTVFDLQEALREDAPILHDNPDAYFGAPPERPHKNIQSVHHWRMGDPEKAFTEAPLIFEHTFTTPMQHQGYLEPQASVVAIGGDGRVQIWTSNKMPYRLRELLAHAIQVPKEKIRITLCPLGGDFGGKGAPMDAPLCYFLAKATGRPVKMVMTYTEELMAGNPRHASVITLRSGVSREGRILARTARALWGGGAYAAFKPTPFVNLHGASAAAGVYGIPHLAIESVCVYTNIVPCGHVRAPGEPQMIFAVESHTDMIAAELKMDPIEFRRRNLLQEGDAIVRGHRLEKVRAADVLEAALAKSGWSRPKPRPTVGRGIALSHREIGIGEANAKLSLEEDGTFTLLTAIPDTGTGSHTILRQVVAEVLGVPLTAIQIRVGDTDTFSAESGIGGSRVTHVAGQATYRAATALRERIVSEAGRSLGISPERLEIVEEGVRERGKGGRMVPLTDLARTAGRRKEPIEVSVHYDSKEFSTVTSFCAQVAEVEVDRETGQMTILRLVTAHDVGTIINPLGHQGQIEGGLIQGMGFAVMEEVAVEEGRVSTLSLGDYKIPTIKDVPPLETVILEEPAGPGPFAGKSIGEGSISPMPAALANALADACGVRLTSLPLTAEKIYAALASRREATAPERTP